MSFADAFEQAYSPEVAVAFSRAVTFFSAGLEIVEVMAADSREARIVETGGGFGSVFGGMALGGAAGATFGPIGFFVGSILGGFYGEAAIEAVLMSDDNPDFFARTPLQSYEKNGLIHRFDIVSNYGERYIIETIIDKATGKVISHEDKGALHGLTQAHIATGGGDVRDINLPKCFSGDANILMANGDHKKIKEIEVGDLVACFDAKHSAESSLLVGRPVTHVFTNVTRSVFELSFSDGRKSLFVTPGHHFLDSTGKFRTIEDLLENESNSAVLVDENGSLLTVVGNRVDFGLENIDAFEIDESSSSLDRGESESSGSRSAGWKTYNFEVAEHHTYIAGGVRVHNQSIDIELDSRGSVSSFTLAALPGVDFVYEGRGFVGPKLMSAYGSRKNIGADGTVFTEVKFRDLVSAFGDWIGLTDGQFGLQGRPGKGFAQFNDGYETRGPEDRLTEASDLTDMVGMATERQWVPTYGGGGYWSNSGISERDVYDEGRRRGLTEQQIQDELADARGYRTRTPSQIENDLSANDYSQSGGNSGSENSSSSPDGGGKPPLIMDLDGDGIEITKLTESTVFIDSNGDGLKNRTAWAGAGDGVLFYDADGDNEISEAREYIFTEWDPTADSDIAALRSYFDSNKDGVFNALDEKWDDFKVMVTQHNGALEAKTLSELGITEINLTPDATRIELPDGSVITGQTEFTYTDPVTGETKTSIVADVTLMSEIKSSRIEKVITEDGANGPRTEVTTGYDIDGAIEFVITKVASFDGSDVKIRYDDNGDGVVDRLQSIMTEDRLDMGPVETVSNWQGSDWADAVLLNQTVTSTFWLLSGEKVVSIQRDSTGGGWYDQIETRTTAEDGAVTIVIEDLGQDGSVLRSSTEVVSADGSVRTERIDRNADGVIDDDVQHAIVEMPDGGRLETTTIMNNDGSVRSSVTESISADGQEKSIFRNIDGEGGADTVEHTSIVVGAMGESVSTIEVRNQDGSLRSLTEQVQSEDALTKTVRRDVDGDGVVDVTVREETVIGGDDAHTTKVTTTNGDGSLRSMVQDRLEGDKITLHRWADLDQSGSFEGDELVRKVIVDEATQEVIDTTYVRSVDGSQHGYSRTVTGQDGLHSYTTKDLDGDGVSDVRHISEKKDLGAAGASETFETRAADGSLQSRTVVTTSADGLSITSVEDKNGDNQDDAVRESVTQNEATGSVTTTVRDLAGDGTTLKAESITFQSADRLVTRMSHDLDGDGDVDEKTEVLRTAEGDQTVTSEVLAGETAVSRSVSWQSGNGFHSKAHTDADGDGVFERTQTQDTVLHTDGSETTTTVVTNAIDTGQSFQTLSASELWVQDDKLKTVLMSDADGDGKIERTVLTETTLETDGSRTTVETTFAGHVQATPVGSVWNSVLFWLSQGAQKLSETRSTVSANGLDEDVRTDVDGDGAFDQIQETRTLLQQDGGTETTVKVFDEAGTLRSQTYQTSDDTARSTESGQDINGDAFFETVTRYDELDDGRIQARTQAFNADGTFQSQSLTETSANGLVKTASSDANGDGTFERIVTNTTEYLGDGGTRSKTVSTSADGSVLSRSTVQTDDAGFMRIVTDDLDGDGVTDTKVTETIEIAENGTVTTTTVSEVRGNETRKEIAKIEADGTTIARTVDVDANGFADLSVTQRQTNDGATHSETEYLSDTGQVVGRATSMTSLNGLFSASTFDVDADGISEHTVYRTVTVMANGSTQTNVSHTTGRGVDLANEMLRVSGNGLQSWSNLDLDGDGIFEFQTAETTSVLINGATTVLTKTHNNAGQLESQHQVTINGTGLLSVAETDFDGDGAMDRSTLTERGASGGHSTEVREYGQGALNPMYVWYQDVSADGWTETQRFDLDGDGFVDRSVTNTVDDSLNSTLVRQDFANDGALLAKVSSTSAANGMGSETTFDVDGDGTVDITRQTKRAFHDNGDMVSTYVEGYGHRVTYSEIRTATADGLRSTVQIDADGNGTVDGVTETTKTLNDVGSWTFETISRYADQRLRSLETVDVSADGRDRIERYDFDGNGIADKTVEITEDAVGERTIVSKVFGESGALTNTFTTVISADGLLKTEFRNGQVQTTEYSALGNGSYTWNNGGTSTNVTAHHDIAADGVETWKVVTTGVIANVANQTEVYEARLDAQAKARVIAEAERLYDTILDRDIDSNEMELLVKYVAYGQLDTHELADDLITGDEFTTRFGAVSNAEFITQVYLNAYGRAPSLVELDDALIAFKDGTLTRTSLAVQISESSEHLAVGNGHMVTNNFDVIMNPAQFERVLDDVYIETLIQRLVDVVYDRDATVQELSYFTQQLKEDVDNADDIVADLLRFDGGLTGTPTNSLKGLDTNKTVEQAFWNALGRAPSGEEHADWVAHISTGRISKEQFIASLAQSVEHIAYGNTHDATGGNRGVTVVRDPNSASNTIEGTQFEDDLYGHDGDDEIHGRDGSDRLEGGRGDDRLFGEIGNDTYVWSKGDGDDTLWDTTANAFETDRLVLTDVTSSEVSLTRESGNVDLQIVIGAGSSNGGTITVINQFYGASYGRGIEAIQFSDGEVWTLDEILERTEVRASSTGQHIHGTDYADNMIGGSGNDTLDDSGGIGGDDILVGGAGNDYLYGDGGSDTYIWSKGDGSDEIRDTDGSLTDIDRLVLTDVVSGDVTLTRDTGSYHLKITIPDTPEDQTLTVINQFANVNDGQGLETIEFSDGVIWTLQDIFAKTQVRANDMGQHIHGTDYADKMIGGSGNDTLDDSGGIGGDDILVGGAGNDFLYGDGGSDTYIWSKGDGSDEIRDTDGSLTDIDRLVLTDVVSGDVTLTRDSGSYHLKITIPDTPEDQTLTVINQFAHVNDRQGLETIEFSDGVIWTLQDILAATKMHAAPTGQHIHGTDYADNMIGGSGNDTLDDSGDIGGDDTLKGGQGIDYLYGDGGSDTYIWSKGDGSDEIRDTNGSLTDIDTLKLTDVVRGDVSLRRVGNDLYVDIDDGGGVVASIRVVDRFYSYTQGRGIERIEFADGEILDVLAHDVSTALRGSSDTTGWNFADVFVGDGTNNSFDGAAGDDTITGGGGDDLLKGNIGNDTYYWAVGDGNDTIDDHIASFDQVDRLVLTDSYASDITLIRENGSEHLLIAHSASGETITAKYQFRNSAESRGVEKIEFADGTEWSHSEIEQNSILRGSGSAETLSGRSNYNDSIEGLEGNDTLHGNNGNDTLDGGLGADSLLGGNGSDTYVWSKADGNDILNDAGVSQSDVDTLILSDVRAEDVTLQRVKNSDDLVIKVADPIEFEGSRGALFYELYNTGALGTTEGIPTTNVRGVGRVDAAFEVGAIDRLHGGDAEYFGLRLFGTVRVGQAGEYTFTTLSDDGSRLKINGQLVVNNDGDHAVQTRSGTIMLSEGTHTIEIEYFENNGWEALSATVQGPDTSGTPTDIFESGMLGRAEDAAHLMNVNPADYAAALSSGHKLTVQNQFYTSGESRGVERIVFADGTSWDVRDIEEKVSIYGTSLGETLSGRSSFDEVFYGNGGHDTITAGNGDDTLYGGTGNDSLIGGNGNDVYYYHVDNGSDIIQDTANSLSEVDILRLFGTSADDVTLTRLHGQDDITLTFKNSNATLTIRDQFNASTNHKGLEKIVFGDDAGVVWLREDIMAKTVLRGTEAGETLSGRSSYDERIEGYGGNDTLNGGNGDDTLVGGKGDDQLVGGNGSDTYVWYKGDGNDFFSDTSNSLTEIDTLLLADTLSTEVNFEQTLNVGDAKLWVTTGIERIAFSDGEIWDRTNGQFLQNALVGTDAADQLFAVYNVYGTHKFLGGGGADSIVGWNFDDYLSGDDGRSTQAAKGGADTINGGAGTDTAAYLESQFGIYLSLFETVQDNSVKVRSDGTVGSVVDGNFYLADHYMDHILNIENVIGSAHGDRIFGDDIANDLKGLAGSDRLYGNGGSDTLIGGDGGDGLWGDDEADVLHGDAGNDSLYGGYGSDTLLGGAGDDVLRGGRGMDVLDGGDGLADTADYQDSEAGVAVDLTAGTGLGGRATGDTLRNIERVFGSAHNDDLRGDALANLLNGFDGNDTLLGHDGNDTLFGGNGDDSIDGGDGSDSIDGGAQADTIHAGNGNDTVDAGFGLDKVYLNEGDDLFVDNTQDDAWGADVVYGGLGNDTILADGGADTIYAGDGDDSVLGGLGDDSIFGGNQYDTIYGGAGNDTVDGGDGRDLVYLDDGDDRFLDNAQNDGHGHDSVYGGLGNDTILGGGGNDTFDGGFGTDSIEGGEGNDVLYGGADWDTIHGGVGSDTITGGNGQDVVYMDDGDDVFIDNSQDDGNGHDLAFGGLGNDLFSGGGGNDTFYGGDGADTLEGGISNDHLAGGNDNDVLIGGDGNDTLEGGKNNDSIEGGAGDDVIYLGSQAYNDVGADTAWGGDGNDSIVGTNGRSTVYGGAGNDTLTGGHDYVTSDVDELFGGEGDDLLISGQTDAPTEATAHKGDHLYGELGNDTLLGGLANDRLYGGDGHDYLAGDGGDDSLEGNVGNDTLDGGSGNDYLKGGGGNDDITGWEGADTIYGGDGDDTLAGQQGEDTVYGGDGNDSVKGGNETDLLYGDAGNDTVEGRLGDDIVHGGSGNDVMHGNEGNDIIIGDSGFDTLYGGTGDDVLTGGSNWDVFVFNDAFGNDTVTDFDVANDFEVIDLSGVGEITDFADLLANHTMQFGADLQISVHLGSSVTLLGVQKDDLSESDFLF